MGTAQDIDHLVRQVGESDLDVDRAQTLHEVPQLLLPRRVDLGDPLPRHQEGAQLLLLRHPRQDLVLQVAGASEVEGSVEGHHRHVAAGPQPVPSGVAEDAPGAGGQARHVGPHGAEQVAAQGERDAEEDAPLQLRRKGEGDHEGDDRDHAVEGLGLPGVHETADVEQADDRHHDDRRQHRLWEVVEGGRQEQEDHHHHAAREDVGQAGPRPGLEVDCGARERARDGVALEDAANQVGEPLADQLLIRVEALPGLGRHRFGDGDGLHEAEQRDDDGRSDELGQDGHVEVRHLRRGQAAGDRAHHGAASTDGQGGRIQRFGGDAQPPAPTVRDDSLGQEAPLVEAAATVCGLDPGEGEVAQLPAALRHLLLELRDVPVQQARHLVEGEGTVVEAAFFGSPGTTEQVHVAGGMAALAELGRAGRHSGEGPVALGAELLHPALLAHRMVEGLDLGRQRRRFHLAGRHLNVPLEAHRPGQGGGDDDGHQHIRQTGVETPEAYHDGKGQHRHAEGREMGPVHGRRHDPRHRLVVTLGALDLDPEDLVELRGGDDDGGGVGETVHHWVGEEVDHQPEAGDAEQQLEGADQESEEDGVGHELLAAGSRQGLQGGRRHQGDDRHRTGGELTAGAEQVGDHGRQERGVEAVVGGQAGELRIGHGLWDQHQGDSHTCDEVPPDGVGVQLPGPRQEGEDPLDHAHSAGPSSTMSISDPRSPQTRIP